MKFVYSLVILSCALWEATGFPYFGGNVDTLSYGDSRRGGMALSRYYNPYYNPRAVGGGMAAFMFRQPEEQTQEQSSQYYLPDRRRQTSPDFIPPQQNEVFYPQQPDAPETPVFPDSPVVTEATELAEPTEKTEVFATTLKAVVAPELAEPEVEQVPEEEPVPKPKKAVTKRKQVKRPIGDDDEEDDTPRYPAGTYFPIFFGYGRSGAAPGGATAIANAYSTGRGGVATSHATAYGEPRPAERKL